MQRKQSVGSTAASLFVLASSFLVASVPSTGCGASGSSAGSSGIVPFDSGVAPPGEGGGGTADGGASSGTASGDGATGGGSSGAVGEGGGSDSGSAPGSAPPSGVPADSSRIALANWSIQSSAVAKDSGAVISTASYAPDGWYPATVPATVLATLVANNVYQDIFTGMNLRSVPGTTYPIGEDFLQQRVPADSPFAPAWWFRTQFPAPAGSAVTLHFDGINYRANIFLNGQSIATSTDVAGTYRRYDFDITKFLVQGQNTLAVQVTAQEPNDLALDFLDWNPAPADRCLGLIRDAYLIEHGGVEIRDPYVATHLDSGRAALTVGAELHNGSASPIQGTLQGTIDAISFRKDVTLTPGATTSITFDPAVFPQLTIASPRLWWPAKLGTQEFYSLDLRFVVGGQVSHEEKIPFGIREVTSTVVGGSRLFSINGKPILIRGGGYTPDLLYRQDPKRQLDELTYVLGLNLNTVRLEGKLENEQFFYLADQLGILVMPGLMCCDYWQSSQNWVPSDFTIAAASVGDQAKRLRKHPSVLTFLYGSDEAAVPQAQQAYVQALRDANWPNPSQASAAETPSPTNGSSGSMQPPTANLTGYKMRGPYDYVPPIYWYEDTLNGGAFGFATEISPGPDVPPIESLQAMLGPSHLWPIDSVWNYHAGALGTFSNIDNFTNAITKRYGQAGGADDFSNKSQLTAYESLRAMFEAYSRNKYTSATGVIQWMLNNAWPGLIWHLYDYYLRPGGAYFGAKKGNEYLHVQYSYDDQSVVVVNHFYQPMSGLKATATLFDIHSAQLFSQTVKVDAAPDVSMRTGIVVPTANQSGSVCFLDLELTDATGKLVSSNFYWLTPHPDVMAAPDPNTQWYFEAIATYADFSPLATLPKVSLTANMHTQQSGTQSSTSVTLQNTSRDIAFFTRVQLFSAAGDEVLPILWDDNYLSILPGATKTVTGTYAGAGAGAPIVKISGYNVIPAQL